jgi:cytochrome c oxidase subunit II
MITKLLGLPVLASEHGAEVDKFIFYVHVIMGLLFAGWTAYFLYVLFRFRKSKNPKASYTGAKTHASSWIEGAVVVAEAVLLIGFAVPLWAKVVDKAPPESQATVIRVMAQQFQWNIRYPGENGKFGRQDVKFVQSGNPWGIDPNDPDGKDDVVPKAINMLQVPVNKPVIAYISSMDVIHSFKVNPLRITQDAIPGLMIPTWFRPTVEGKYLINCAQLCGNSHYFMKGFVHVVSQASYEQWLKENGTVGSAPAASGNFE